MRHSDRSWRSIRSRGIAVRDTRWRTQRVAGWVTDISARKPWRKEPLAVMHETPNPQLARHACSSSFVHALRNHLSVVLGYVDLALEETGSADSCRKELLAARHAASEAAALVELRFS